jgi:enamine deaminase RidA (YjgF/YER057c/UK114 family)
VTFDPIDPPELGRPSGFSHGMLAPAGARMLLVAGQIAAGPGGEVGADDFVEQFGIALDRVIAVVRAAGGDQHSIGRLTIYVTDLATYRARRQELAPIYRQRMGRHFPAMALVEVVGLVDPRALVEIEATAAITA